MATPEQILEAMQAMCAQMASAQQSNTDALSEVIKKMPKLGCADTGDS